MEDIKPSQTLVNIVLDRSGSMESSKPGTISGYNEYLKNLRSDTETSYSITLVQFDSPKDGPELTVSYSSKPLAEVPDLTTASYQPRGMTPLYDAIGECIRRVSAKDGEAVLTVIITDGLENASREFTKESIKTLIEEKRALGWKFSFLGANIDSYGVGESIGIGTLDTSNYAVGKEQSVYANLAQSSRRYSANVRAHGPQAAGGMAMFTNVQRASMGDRPEVIHPPRPLTGGLSSARPPFRNTPGVLPRRRTTWRESTSPSPKA